MNNDVLGYRQAWGYNSLSGMEYTTSSIVEDPVADLVYNCIHHLIFSWLNLWYTCCYIPEYLMYLIYHVISQYILGCMIYLP